jgi:RimJ/RimL family protein N-acetyltransferase
MINRVDYQTNMFIIGITGKQEEHQQIVTTAGYFVDYNKNMGEISLTVDESVRGNRVGFHALMKVIEFAHERRLTGLFGYISENNSIMLHLLEKIPYKVYFEKKKDLIHMSFKFSDIIEKPNIPSCEK